MKIIHADYKKGQVKFKFDTAEDAWHLSKLIKPGDLLFGKTERKIRLGGAEEKGSVVKKIVWLEISAEKTEMNGQEIRVNGTVLEGLEDIPQGSHQSISLTIHDEARLTKPQWSLVDKNRLEQAARQKSTSIIAIIFDREEAYLAQLTGKGFEIKSHIQGNVSRKDQEGGKEDFFQTLAQALTEMDSTLHPSKIIVASPSFWKEYFLKELSEPLLKKTIQATVSSVDEPAFAELIRRPELNQTLAEDTAAQEEKQIEEALAAVRKDQAAYGIPALEDAASTGNLAKVLVAESLFSNEQGNVEKKSWLEQFLSSAESVGATIHIMTQEQSEKKLMAFKGILGIRRWQIA